MILLFFVKLNVSKQSDSWNTDSIMDLHNLEYKDCNTGLHYPTDYI